MKDKQKNKLINLLRESHFIIADYCSKTNCEECEVNYEFGEECFRAIVANHLIASGLTIQTTPISYERLLHIARQMHLWIFLNCADEQKAYDELKITAEENVVLGCGGRLEITMPEPPKEEV